MADPTSLMRRYCPDAAGAAAARQAQKQQRPQKKPREEQQKTNPGSIFSDMFHGTSPALRRTCSAAAGTTATTTSEVAGGDIAAPASTAGARGARLVLRPFGVILLLQLLFVWFSLLPSSLDLPQLLQPVSAASWPAAAAAVAPATAFPLLLLLSPGPAAASVAAPQESKPSTTEQASAAVKSRWGMWRQRLNAAENPTSPPEGPAGASTDRLAAAKAGKRRDISPTSKNKAERFFYSVPLQLAGSTLLLAGGNLASAPEKTAPPAEAGEAEKARKGSPAKAGIPVVSGAVLPSKNTAFPAAAVDRTATAGDAAAGVVAGAGFSALRAAPAMGVVPPTSRRIALSLRAPAAAPAAAGASSDTEEPYYVAGAGGLREATAAAGGGALRPHHRLENLPDGAADPTLAAPSWLPPQDEALPYSVQAAGADIAAPAQGGKSFAVTRYGGGVTAAAGLDKGQKETPFHKNVRPQQQESAIRSSLKQSQQVLRQKQKPRGSTDMEVEKQAKTGDREPHISKQKARGGQEPVLLIGHSPDAPQQQAVEQPPARGLPYEKQAHVGVKELEENKLPDVESLPDVWASRSTSQQQQYMSPGAGRMQVFDFAEWRRRLQQQRGLAGGSADQQVGVVLGKAMTANQQEAEELFGRGTTVHLLKSRRDYEAFIRREVLQQERVAVVLFFGRHCPYCMMFKGLFNEAAATVPAALGDGSTVFAAKEVALFEEDFADDEDEEMGAGGAVKTPPKPVEAMLGVTHIPQIRVIAPLHRAKQRQVMTALGRGSGDVAREAERGAGDVAGDRGIIAAPPATEEVDLDDSVERGAPQVFWLPPLRKGSGVHPSTGLDPASRTAAGGTAAAAAPYWTARLGHSEFSPEGIYKFLVENMVLDCTPKPEINRRTGPTEIAAAGDVTAPAPGSPLLPSYPNPAARQSRFRQSFPELPTDPLTLAERVLHAIAEECNRDSPLELQEESIRHEALCSGSSRWDAVEERETPASLRLHDALSTLVYILKRWVPMAGKGDRLSRDAEATLQRFLEICRYVFPWHQVRRSLFSLQVLLHTQGSGAEPIYWQWRKPGFLVGGEGGGAGDSTADAVNVTKQEPEGGAATNRWGWWHGNVETATEKAAKDAHAEGSTGAGGRGGSVAGGVSSSGGGGHERTHAGAAAAQTKQPGGLPLPKATWIAAVKSLELAGIGGAATAADSSSVGSQVKEPRLLQCETLLCGVWTLFHVLAEGASATFRTRVRRAAEQAASREGDWGRKRGRATGEKRKDSVDLVFYGALDNVGVFAAQRYMELLQQKETYRSSSPYQHAGGRRAKSRARAANPEEDVSFMLYALEEQLGVLESSKQLQLFEEKLQRLQSRLVFPAALLQQTLRDFIEHFFSCFSCRIHFLQCYNRGFFGARDVVYPDSVVATAAATYQHKRQLVLEANAAAAGEAEGAAEAAAGMEEGGGLELPAALWRPSPRQDRVGLTATEAHKEKKNFLHLRLWLWRLHNAVNIRTASEATRNMITEHPEIFLSKEELLRINPPPSLSAAARASLLTRDGKEMVRDYSPLQEKALGVGYYVGVDPRWPLRSTCPECRNSTHSTTSSSSSNSSSSSVGWPNVPKTQPWRRDGFVLTAEYLLQKEKEEDICIHSDFYNDFNLKEVKRFLSRTYWSTERLLLPNVQDADLFFSYDKQTFVHKL